MPLMKVNKKLIGFPTDYVVNDQTFTASEGQTAFTLTNGTYEVGTNRLEVFVGGIRQTEGVHFNEDTRESFSFVDGLTSGTEVYAQWYEIPIGNDVQHATTHKLGGYDELNVKDLGGYDKYVKNEFEERGINVKNFGASGSDQSTTGTINNGSDSLSVASVIDFEIGHGISIKGAGTNGVDLVTKVTDISAGTLTLQDQAGASVTDAVVNHDDTVAIQNAIDSLSTDDSLYFPSGTYLVSSKLTLKSNITLFSFGGKIKTNSDWDHVIELNTINNATLSGLEVEGYNDASSNGQLIYITNCNNIIVEKCKLFNSGENGVHLANGSSSCKITNNTCHDNSKFAISLNGSKNNNVENNVCYGNGNGVNGGGIGVYSSADNNTILGNSCNNNITFGILVYRSNNNNVANNNCNNNGNNNVCSGIYVSSYGSNYNSIVGNVCNENKEHGIVLQGENLTNFTIGNTVTGNTCKGNGTGGSVGKGIYLASGQREFTVSGNVSNENKESGIEINSNCARGSVSGNACINNGQSNGSSASGIRLYDTSVEGTANTYEINVNGNTCTDSQGTATQQYGVSLEVSTADVLNCLVIGNMLRANGTSGILNNGTSNTVPSGTNVTT